MHTFVSRGMVYPIVMKLGKQLFNIRMLAHLTDLLILNFGDSLKEHSQLANMRITYHSMVNFHITETR